MHCLPVTAQVKYVFYSFYLLLHVDCSDIFICSIYLSIKCLSVQVAILLITYVQADIPPDGIFDACFLAQKIPMEVC